MPYTVVGLLGRGGTGVVELVEDQWGRRVARKRLALYGSARQIDGARRRLRREAEVLRRLAHPGIVSLLGVEDDGESVVLTMPWMAGGSLHDRITVNGPMRPREVEDLAAALLGALAAAHRAGVVHRDVSPANILFSAEGHPVLADFGTAACRDFTWGLTGEGMTIGTPAFMAPEQARGERVGPAGDVFSLGASLHFALTGASPVAGAALWAEPATIVQRAAAGCLEPLPASVPPPLRSLVSAMCHPDPALRPSAARAWPSAVRTGDLPAHGTSARAAGAGPSRRSRRRWVPASAVVAVAVAAAVAAGLGLYPVRRAASAGPSARTAVPTVVTAPPCQPLAYQLCGSPPAPFTDGTRCVAGHDDLDGLADNGCEAAPDTVGGSRLTVGTALVANLVPRGEVDHYSVVVKDRFQLFCDGTAHITLTAPAAAVDKVTVTDAAGRSLGSAVSANGRPAGVDLPDPDCFHDDTATLTLAVSSAPGSAPTAATYRLVVTGSY